MRGRRRAVAGPRVGARTLAFVARRLLAEPVGIVFAAREPSAGGSFAACPSSRSEGSATATRARCWRRRVPGRAGRAGARPDHRRDPRQSARAARAAARADRDAAGGRVRGARPRTRSRAGSRRATCGALEALPEDARLLLLVAAAEPVGDPLLLLARGRAARGRRPRGAPAEDAGLLTIGSAGPFRHPLVRSAVYRSASPRDRRAAHLALAEATDREADPDRRAWHLAAAAAGPTRRSPLELERSAGRAQARGGLAAAAAFLQRAVALTGDPARRADRALAAAQASLQAGAFDVALGLLATAEAGPLDELQRARLDLLRAEAAYSESRGSDAPALLLRAAQDARAARSAARARDLPRRVERGAVRRAAREHREPARRLARGAGRPAAGRRSASVRPAAGRLRAGVHRRSRRGGAGARSGRRPALRASDVSLEEVLRWGWLATAAAVMVWDYETCLAVADARGRARPRGRAR